MKNTIIFRKVLEIDPKLCGGVGKEGYLAKLKKWFYYWFTKQNYLSIRKLAIVGQKLPKYWEGEMIEMRGRVRAKQKPVMRPCGKIHIAGFRYAHFVNTYHVPIWYESVGKYSGGKKDSGSRSAKKYGKETDWFM